MKRVKRCINTKPNPLFESWLKEWREEAKRNGSESQYCFARALNSLKKYPFRLETGKECFILENFGVKLCMMLDEKLSDYNKSKQGTEWSISKNLKECGQDEALVVNDNILNCEKVNLMSNSEEKNYPFRVEEGSKRKHCMDSPKRTLKCLKDSNNTKHEKKSKGYLPSYRSGSYAIILTLYKSNKQMTKAELETEAQELCNTSFKKLASSDSYYTAWSSMATLLKKGLVEKNGRPARFSLTSKGTELALQLQSEGGTEEQINSKSSPRKDNFRSSCSIVDKYTECNWLASMNYNEDSEKNQDLFYNRNKVKIANDIYPEINLGLRLENGSVKEQYKSYDEHIAVQDNCHPSAEMFILLPNKFDVILYVDSKEIENKQHVESDKIVKYLKKKNINFEVKFLNVGDYLWICRDRENGQELVLPYIVERKRMDDLASSIRDGRFHEQKFRLKNCGIENCIYLVEKYGNESLRLGLPLPTIQQAISNTKVIDGFSVKLTNNNDDSMNYLSLMTNFLAKIFTDKTLGSCSKKDLPPYNMSDDLILLMSFSEFNKDSMKMRKFTVRNMLLKQLLQFSGLSVEKAKAIVQVYPTPKCLMKALQNGSGESFIAKLTCGALNRSIGVTLAKSLHQLYTSLKLT